MTRLRPISVAYMRRLTAYRPAKKRFLSGQKCCVADCKTKATDLHHRNGRSGDLLLDERYWRAVCRRHHNQIHQDTAWARAHDLLPPAGHPWNTPDKP